MIEVHKAPGCLDSVHRRLQRWCVKLKGMHSNYSCVPRVHISAESAFRRKSHYEGKRLMRIEMPTTSKEKAHKAQRERRRVNARRTKLQIGRMVEKDTRRKEEKVVMNARQS